MTFTAMLLHEPLNQGMHDAVGFDQFEILFSRQGGVDDERDEVLRRRGGGGSRRFGLRWIPAHGDRIATASASMARASLGSVHCVAVRGEVNHSTAK